MCFAHIIEIMKRIKPAPLHSKNSGLEIKNAPEFKSGKYKYKPSLWRNVARLSALFFSISLVLSVGLIVNVHLPAAQAQNIQTSTASRISSNDYLNLINSLLGIINSLKEQLDKLQQNINFSGKISLPAAAPVSLFSLPLSVLNISQNLNKFLTPQPSVIAGNPTAAPVSKIDDYYKNFLAVTKNAGFTDDEIKSMLKISNGKNIPRLEQLMEQANNGYDLDKLKDSFSAWHNFDERIIASLKTIPVSGGAFSLNNSFISWLQYHSGIASAFAAGNLTAGQIGDLYAQFQTKAAAQNLLMENSTAAIKNSRSFSFVKSAEAVTCAATAAPDFYYIGGPILLNQVCDDVVDEVLNISLPCGGRFNLNAAVEAINPYFKGYLKTGDMILGKTILNPGSCTLAGVPTPYEGAVIFYGASGGL